MKTKRYELICIQCPVGCLLTVEKKEQDILVKGNSCPRGDIYARTEVTHPVRTLTTTVPLKNGTVSRIPVKTKDPVPKEKMMDCMKEIKSVVAQSPVHAGDVLLDNIAGTGIPLIATKSDTF